MSTVKHIHGNTMNEQKAVLHQLRGVRIKDIITKFFYRDNHLCFQIFICEESGENISYREFSDYAEYKKAFTELQQAKAKDLTVKVQGKNLAPVMSA